MKLHTFQEAVECINAGGWARRFGGSRYYLHWGDLYKCRDYYGTKATFSCEDQQSNDWVLTSPERVAEIEKRQRDEYEARMASEAARREESGEEQVGCVFDERPVGMWSKIVRRLIGGRS